MTAKGKITCPACMKPMREHHFGICPTGNEVFDDACAALDASGAADLDDGPAVFVELLTLRHFADDGGTLDPLIDRISEFASEDLAVLVMWGVSVVYRFMILTAEAKGMSTDALIQELALTLARDNA